MRVYLYAAQSNIFNITHTSKAYLLLIDFSMSKLLPFGCVQINRCVRMYNIELFGMGLRGISKIQLPYYINKYVVQENIHIRTLIQVLFNI